MVEDAAVVSGGEVKGGGLGRVRCRLEGKVYGRSEGRLGTIGDWPKEVAGLLVLTSTQGSTALGTRGESLTPGSAASTG